jgi:hypothetical protein
MSDKGCYAIMNNFSPQGDANIKQLYGEFVLATPEKVQFYKMFEKEPIIVEGPEYLLDLSYWLVHEHPDLKLLEKGILVSDVANDIAQNKVRH